MKKLLLILASAAGLYGQTAINDTLYLQGSPWTGTISVCWPAFTSASGTAIAKGCRDSYVTAGAVSVSLLPTEGAAPAFVYTASYKQTTGAGRGTTWSETWGVAASPSITTLAAVRLTSSQQIYAALSHTHIIANVTGLQAALDAKQAAGSYLTSVPAPGVSTLGGVVSGQCTTTTGKLMGYDTAGNRICESDQTGSVGSGITSLNGLTGSTQTFAKVDDTNVTLGIGSSGTAHTFALGWTGQLPKARQHALTLYSDGAYSDPSWLTLSIAKTTGLQAALDAKEAMASKGTANGYAGLGSDAKVPDAYLHTVPAMLGYTPEDTTKKGAINGYAGLDAGGKVPTAQIPTLNQNTTGTAANLSGTPALPNGTTATTQSQADGSTKLATTAYVDTGLGGKASATAATTVNGQVCTLGSTCTVADSTKVPTTTTVNGHALSANVTLTASDVSLGGVTNDAQTKAAIVPNTAPSAGQLLVGNAGGTAYAPVTVSGSCTMASTGVITCSSSGVSTSSSDTFTNKTIDAEGTGNVITAPFKIYIPAAGANQSSSGPGLDIPLTNGPLANYYGTAPQAFGALDFADGSAALTATTHIALPSDWTGAVDVKYLWFSGSTSTNSAVWTAATSCIADTEDLIAPAFNAVQTVAKANNATANTRNSASITGITTTGCAAGETMFLRIGRDPTHASDTLAATAVLLGIEVTIRRAM